MTGGAAASSDFCATVQCMSGTSHYTDSHIQCYSYVMCILLCSIFSEDTVLFMYLCNDRELISMNSQLLRDE